MLQLKNIKKNYKTGDFVQQALKGIDLTFRKNEFVAILGPSGSGKTTLLNIIGGLDRYDEGDLIINNKSTKKFKETEWDAYRNNCIGFVFQNYNLIGHISVLENVELGMTLSGVNSKKRRKKALEVLERVGLKEHAHKKPNQLSGGQMQRVAIARALANDPDIILADEPTGALDSKTSVQIMELIKEIANDKLVIMVTHNPDLAKEYSNRIIEVKDGELINDTNPVKKEEKENKFSIKKTSMNFRTALNLSFNNIKTKKGRTLLTAFASSIGIIGIALILSLSNGFQLQIDKFERDTLSQMPIIVQPTVIVASEEEQKKMLNDRFKESEESFTDKQVIRPLITFNSYTHQNKIDLKYIEYIEKIDPEVIGGLAYTRATKLNVLYKNNDKVDLIDSTKILFPLPEELNNNESAVIEDNFDLIYGKMPTEYNELLLVVDTKNRVELDILKLFGYDEDSVISFEEFLNKEFKVVLNEDYYKEFGDYFRPSLDYNELYDNGNNITLKITGIIRGKEGNKFAQVSGTGLCYKEGLMKKVMELNENSKIVIRQKEKDFNVLTGEQFDEKTTKDTILSYIGATSAPYMINIYPKDFDSKDKLIEYLDEYNKDLSEDDKIVYSDYAATITSLSGGIMDAVTVVLIAFSAISLIVSSIMIGIIMYISVLERTKEIGILKALGARKRDIRRVFNAETFIIGLASGTIGIIIAELLTIPANVIIEKLTELANVAQLNPIHAIILLTISIILTVIGGYIPAKVASKKDAVESLRTE